MNIAKILKQAGIAVALVLGAQASQAVLITSSFSAEVLFGPYIGTVGSGSFTYDDAALVTGDESLGPTGGGIADEGLTAFSFTILGQTYSIGDDIDFPDFPIIDFLGGVPDFIDFAVVDLAPVDILEPGVVVLGVAGPLSAGLPGGPDFEAEAFVLIPEPASLALFGIGLLGMGWRRSRV